VCRFLDEEGRELGKFVFESCWQHIYDKLCNSDADDVFIDQSETTLFVYLTRSFATSRKLSLISLFIISRSDYLCQLQHTDDQAVAAFIYELDEV
jgi:hypothetical protein